jgi:hypothetical protein
VALTASCALSACFWEPARPNATASDAGQDGAHDGSGSNGSNGSNGAAPQARLIHHAYYCLGGASPGMDTMHYSISTSGLADGDLLLFLANVDNGANDVFVLPPGFTQLYQNFYLGGDGQTFAAGYKMIGSAADEPISYSEMYGPNISSACAVIMLVAVTGYNAAHPFDTTTMTVGSTADDPVVLRGRLTTTVANDLLVLAGGADWLSGYGSNATNGNVTFDPPPGYTLVEGITDSGGISVVWTTQMVATRVAATPGDTGAEDGTMTATPTITGIPWTVELAIEPAP